MFMVEKHVLVRHGSVGHMGAKGLIATMLPGFTNVMERDNVGTLVGKTAQPKDGRPEIPKEEPTRGNCEGFRHLGHEYPPIPPAIADRRPVTVHVSTVDVNFTTREFDREQRLHQLFCVRW